MDGGKGKSILIVDDDLPIREVIAETLVEAGYSVATAENGAVALELLRQSPKRFSLVLLDLMMPVVDGWEFRARQLAEPRIRDVPIVIISAGGRVEQKAVNLRAAGWLRKPMCIELLLGEIDSVLTGSPRPSPPPDSL